MQLIVGLGNPDSKYKNNRHNVGFMVIDELVNDHNASDISKSTFQGQLYKSNNTLFLKPTTYMNLSGDSVRAVCDYYKPELIIVIHDDLDLPFGTVRFKIGGGNGGHNGLKSIDAHIGKEYLRVRIGIGKPLFKSDVANFVLSDFPKAQYENLKDIIRHCSNATMKLLEMDVKEVSSKYSLKNNFDNNE
jgi:PTH1 family peptidyl-tRNA hydrolase